MNIKQIKRFPRYSVSDCGKVFSTRGQEMVLQENIDGYYVVNLYIDGKYYHRRVNRLVAETFIPNPENLPIVNHKDHDRKNNHFSNLEWCTEEYNSRVSVEMYPEKRKALAKITKDQAIEICELVEQGCRNKEIQEKTDVPLDIIKKIRAGVTWTEVSKNYNLVRSKRSVSEATVRFICNKIAEGLKNREILELVESKGVTRSLIKHIRGKTTWAWVSNDYF